ncbi:MAG: flagellar basal body rod protein FlgB [Chitinivibrionales bacterium]
MLNKALFSKTNLPTVLKSLDAAMLRSRTIGNNIANVNTPGFKRVDVQFEDQLRNALSKGKLRGAATSEGHMQLGRKNVSAVFPQAYRPNDPSLPSGVNNVDIDTEMAKLAENQILFNYGMRFLRGGYKKLNAAIKAQSLPLQ